MDEWDFFFGVFSESRCFGLQFWHFMDPCHPRYDSGAVESLKASIKGGYAAIDTACGRVWNCSNANGITMAR
jgi:predicted AlkP superfamily phosphohydrolase/phosphomutase